MRNLIEKIEGIDEEATGIEKLIKDGEALTADEILEYCNSKDIKGKVISKKGKDIVVEYKLFGTSWKIKADPELQNIADEKNESVGKPPLTFAIVPSRLKGKKYIVMSQYHTIGGFDTFEEALKQADRANKIEAAEGEAFRVFDFQGNWLNRNGYVMDKKLSSTISGKNANHPNIGHGIGESIYARQSGDLPIGYSIRESSTHNGGMELQLLVGSKPIASAVIELIGKKYGFDLISNSKVIYKSEMFGRIAAAKKIAELQLKEISHNGVDGFKAV